MKVRKLAKRWRSRPWTFSANYRFECGEWQTHTETRWAMSCPTSWGFPFMQRPVTVERLSVAAGVGGRS